MLAVFGIGITELIVVALIGGMFLAMVIVAVVILMSTNQKDRD
jgi:hypothetical protein